MADRISPDDMSRIATAMMGEGTVPLSPADMAHPEVRKAAGIALLADTGLFAAVVAGPAVGAWLADTAAPSIGSGLTAAGRAMLDGFKIAGESIGERLNLLAEANDVPGLRVPEDFRWSELTE